MEQIKPTKEEEAEYLAYHTQKDFFENLELGLKRLQQKKIRDDKPLILLCGGMAGFDKGTLNFFDHYYQKVKAEGEEMYFLSEVTAEYRRYSAEHSSIPQIYPPHLLAKEMVVTGMKIDVSEKMLQLIREKKYLIDAVDLLKRRHPKLGEGYAEAWCYYAFLYQEQLLNQMKPKRVIIWNEFYAFHFILRMLCKEKHISVVYAEFGCLPGSISLDKTGQVGESVVAVHYRCFRLLPITFEDRKEIKEILIYLRKTGLNRNVQPQKKMNVKSVWRYRSGRPTIVFFGQNDFESGLFPEKNRKKHSPIFTGTKEALIALSELAEKNNWNFIYKPHPIMKSLGFVTTGNTDLDRCMTGDVDINSVIDLADVVVTIFSQSAYIALIREKPVVMLGYSELRGKGCAYEAFKYEQIEKKIKMAVKRGFTKTQRKHFEMHCAQLRKYYLYDDLTKKEYNIGKNGKSYCI